MFVHSHQRGFMLILVHLTDQLTSHGPTDSGSVCHRLDEAESPAMSDCPPQPSALRASDSPASTGGSQPDSAAAAEDALQRAADVAEETAVATDEAAGPAAKTNGATVSAAAAASAVSGYKSAATAAPAATKPRAILPAKRKADSEAAPLHDGWAKLPKPAGGPPLKLPPLRTGTGSGAGSKPTLKRTGTTESPRLGGGSCDDAAKPGALRRTEPSSESPRKAAAAAAGAKPVQLLSLGVRRTTADDSPRGGRASSDSPRSMALQDDIDLFGAPHTKFTS